MPANHRRADRAGDVIVARRDVGGKQAERVERRFVAPLELFIHFILDHVHGQRAVENKQNKLLIVGEI
jgi:hypothetical protein